jgi:hypothetical protein
MGKFLSCIFRLVYPSAMLRIRRLSANTNSSDTTRLIERWR